MKKKLLIPILAALTVLTVKVSAQAFTLTPWSQCYSASGTNAQAAITSTPAGATSYSWTIVGSSGSCNGTYSVTNATGSSVYIMYPCCGMYTINCMPYNGSTPMTSSAMINTVIIQCPNWLTLTTTPNNGLLCAGQTGTITAAGAASYTWSNGSTTPNIVVSPSVSTCYTLSAVNAQGCNITTTACFSVFPNPNITITPANNSICQGGSATLTASGANTYVWNPGSLTGPSVVVSPTATASYTVIGTNATGCTSQAAAIVTVNPIPVITISGGGTICSGATANLSGAGAITYTWLPGNTPFPSIMVTPIANTVYTLLGASAAGCIGQATTMVNVNTSPTVSVSGNFTVCRGSSTNLSASGAGSYVWSTGATTSTINILPYWTLNYTLTGTDPNGCTSSHVFTVVRDSSCTDVWPGDANSDGVVNSSDVFEIGLAYSSTGASRSPGGNAYTSQHASNWVGNVSTGKNKCNADCNGDGTVDNGDTLAIFNNYSLTHSFKQSETLANGDINIIGTQAIEGAWNKADIVLGSSTNPINQLYGVAFDINFDNSLVESNSAYIVYTASFLNASNQNVQFRKTDFANGKIYAASVRISNTNVNGDGKIGEFWYKVKTNLPANSSLNLSVSDSKKIGNTGSVSSLTGGSAAVAIVKTYVGVNEASAFDQSVQFFPNPANNQLTLQSEGKTTIDYTVCDLVGRQIAKGEFNGTKTIDVSSFQSGTYIVRFASGSHVSHKKLVIE